MAVRVLTLIPPKKVESTQTTQYTAVDARAIIDKFTGVNSNTINVTISVNLVTSGDTPGDRNLVVHERAIAPNETYTFPELVGQVLESGSYISTLCSSSTSLTIRASGREIT